jgi:hypothetical protein
MTLFKLIGIRHLETENLLLKRNQTVSVGNSKEIEPVDKKEEISSVPSKTFRLAEAMLKWLKFSLIKTPDATRIRERFYVWQLQALLLSFERNGMDETLLKTTSWLDVKWNEKKRELIKANRYPMVFRFEINLKF